MIPPSSDLETPPRPHRSRKQKEEQEDTRMVYRYGNSSKNALLDDEDNTETTRSFTCVADKEEDYMDLSVSSVPVGEPAISPCLSPRASISTTKIADLIPAFAPNQNPTGYGTNPSGDFSFQPDHASYNPEDFFNAKDPKEMDMVRLSLTSMQLTKIMPSIHWGLDDSFLHQEARRNRAAAQQERQPKNRQVSRFSFIDFFKDIHLGDVLHKGAVFLSDLLKYRCGIFAANVDFMQYHAHKWTGQVASWFFRNNTASPPRQRQSNPTGTTAR